MMVNIMKGTNFYFIKKISPLIMAVLVCFTAVVCAFFSNRAIMVSSTIDSPIYFGNRDKNFVALTFNCYESAENVLKIAEIVEDYGFNCTFFFGGCFADDNIDLIIRLYEKGHEIGNHGYFHKAHSKLSYEQNYNEIKRMHDLILGQSGIVMNLFAPPSGDFSNQTLEACKNLGYKVIMWSKDTIDWRDKNKKTVYNRATNNICAGDIVLMHPTNHTVDALSDIISNYISKGLAVSTVSRCLE